MRLIKYDEEGKESRAKRDLTFARENSDRILKCGARKLRSNLIMELNRKGHSPVFLLKNVLYISLIYLLHSCCICVAYDVIANTLDNFPQLL